MYNRFYDWLFPLIILLVILGLLGIVAFFGDRECAMRAGMLGLDYDFKFFSLVNCRVSVNEIWIPIENYLVTS